MIIAAVHDAMIMFAAAALDAEMRQRCDGLPDGIIEHYASHTEGHV